MKARQLLAAALLGSLSIPICAQALKPTAPATGPTTRPTAAVAAPALHSTTQPATVQVVAASATRPTTRLAAASTRPAAGPAMPDADVIFKQFSSPDWKQRRKAQDQLVRLGEPAIPFINQLIHRAPTDEARKDAEAALAQIKENRLIGPSYITLHVKDAGPAEVFAEISRQCFTPLLTYPDNLWQQGAFSKLTLDFDHQPFWKVFPQVCQKVNVDLRQMGQGMRLMRGGAMQLEGFSQIDGAFLIVANQITYSRVRNLGAGQGEQTNFGISLMIYPEPKLTVLRTANMISLTEATDDHGNSLIPATGARAMYYGGSNGMGGFTVFSPLRYPRKNIGTRIVTFKGSTTLVLQTGVRKLQIPDILHVNQLPKLVDGMQVTFMDMKKTNESWQLRLKVPPPNFGGQEWQQLMQDVQTRLKILDSKGKPLDHRGLSSNGNNNSVDLTLDFARSTQPDGHSSGDPASLVWLMPTQSKELTVPISLKNLPLFDDK